MKKIEVLISREEIDRRTKELGQQITDAYQNEGDLVLIGVQR